VAAVKGIRLVNGVDPLQPAGYAAFLNMAAGVPAAEGYSIILPAWESENEAVNLDVGLLFADADPVPQLLAVLDVKTVVSQFPIQSPWLTELFRHDREELIVYRNRFNIRWPAVFQRVESVPDLDAALDWLQTGVMSYEAVVIGGHSLDGPQGHTPADLLRLTPNQLSIRAIGPGLLIVSELAHPGWYATVDGVPTEIVVADAVLRGVYLEEGEHQVEMVYQPRSVTLGAIVTGVTLFISLLGLLLGKS
jgi:hypothetical protein